MSLADKIKDIGREFIILLVGEDEPTGPDRPLYTKAELHELFNIRKDYEKFPEKSE